MVVADAPVRNLPLFVRRVPVRRWSLTPRFGTHSCSSGESRFDGGRQRLGSEPTHVHPAGRGSAMPANAPVRNPLLFVRRVAFARLIVNLNQDRGEQGIANQSVPSKPRNRPNRFRRPERQTPAQPRGLRPFFNLPLSSPEWVV